jgi:simple sugar transport system ATP-binding protein
MLANQPTRGIDVVAADFVRKKLLAMRDNGAGILLISADIDEVLEVSDSIIVMHNGKIAAYFPDAKEATAELLGEYMLGLKTQSPEEIGRVFHEQQSY